MTEQTTALTVVERAVVALKFDEKKEQELRELAARTADITTITNADGRAQVHAARMVLKNQRLQLKEDAETAREDATKYSKAVIALEKRAIAIISGEEDRLQAIQDSWDSKIEAEKQAKIAAEQKRMADLQERVAELRGNRMLSPTSGADLIAGHINDLESIPVDDSFEEFREQADAAKVAGLEFLRNLHAAAVAHEAEQARIKAEREELARQRAAEAICQAAERGRIAEEDRVAKAARDAEAAKQAEELRLQREAQAKADADAKAIRDAEAAKLAADRAVFEQQQAAARKVKEEEERAERDRARLASIKKPADDELLGVLAKHYNVPAAKVIEWILSMDLSKDIAA